MVRGAVIALENMGAKVASIVCDGPPEKKQGGAHGEFRGKITLDLPTLSSVRWIRAVEFASFGIPYAYKCIRNLFFNVKNVQVKSKTKCNFSPYKSTFLSSFQVK